MVDNNNNSLPPPTTTTTTTTTTRVTSKSPKKRKIQEISPLKKWLFENQCYIKKGDSRPYTHLLLDGGKLHIPSSLVPVFHNKYARDLKNGYKFYICETKTEVFKFFCDLDFFEDAPLDDEKIKEYAKCIQEAVRSLYSTIVFKNAKVIVCTTDPKTVQVNGASYIKTGVHLLWTGGVLANKENAMILRKAIIQLLESRFGPRESYNPWADVVDETVFKENGLRMVGSRKMTKCKECKGRDTEICSFGECDRGKVDEGRVYMPMAVINASLKEDKTFLTSLRTSFKTLVLETSIVVLPPPQNDNSSSNSENEDEGGGEGESAEMNKKSKIVATPFTTFPVWFDNSATATRKLQKDLRVKKRVLPPGQEEREVMSSINKTRVVPTDPRIPKLNIFCRKNMPEVYSKANIVELYHCETDAGEFYLATLDTNFCMNIGREHASNRIYYYINTKAVYQKCFCTCNTIEGRIFKEPCKTFRSHGRELSAVLKYSLFPKERHRAQSKAGSNSTTTSVGGGSDGYKSTTPSEYKKEQKATLDQMRDVLDALFEEVTDKKSIEKRFNR